VCLVLELRQVEVVCQNWALDAVGRIKGTIVKNAVNKVKKNIGFEEGLSIGSGRKNIGM
jgi:hypothetical protein